MTKNVQGYVTINDFIDVMVQVEGSLRANI
jgi:hypothetical protein